MSRYRQGDKKLPAEQQIYIDRDVSGCRQRDKLILTEK
jgi:hypothetical protein